MLKKYLDFKLDTLLLATRAGTLACIFCVMQVARNHDFNLLIAVFGVFAVSAIEVFSITSRSRIINVLVFILLSTTSFTLGGILSNHYLLCLSILSSLAILVGLSAYANPAIVTIILFTASLYTIGTGVSHSIHQALSNGIYYSIGGLSVWLTCCIELLIFKKIVITNTNILKRIFVINKDTLAYTVLLVITVAIAYTIEYHYQIPQGYSAPMTVLLIFKLDKSFLWQRINHRLFGTLLGSMTAFIISIFVNNPYVLAFLMLPTMFFIIIALAKHYGAYVFFLTPMVVIIYKFMTIHSVQNFDLEKQRIIGTILAVCCIAIVIGLAFIVKFIKKRY